MYMYMYVNIVVFTVRVRNCTCKHLHMYLLHTPQQLEADLALHGNQVKALEDQANRLVLGKHFESETIKAKVTELTKRCGL